MQSGFLDAEFHEYVPFPLEVWPAVTYRAVVISGQPILKWVKISKSHRHYDFEI